MFVLCVTVCGLRTRSPVRGYLGTLARRNADGLAAALNKQSWCECCDPMRNTNPAACGRTLLLKEESGEESVVPGAVMALPMKV